MRSGPLLGFAVLLLAGCAPFPSGPAGSLKTSGSGNGDAGGTWTDHFKVDRRPWQFLFSVDCARAGRGWSIDLTLEQMHPNRYYDAVPLDVGWSEGAPAGQASRATVIREIQRTGEFWFIVRASSGCRWQIAAPVYGQKVTPPIPPA